jgi:hypothetical protein
MNEQMRRTGRLQTSTANEEPIDIRLFRKIAAVLLADTAAIDDSGVISSLRGDRLLQPLANSGMDFLRLLCLRSVRFCGLLLTCSIPVVATLPVPMAQMGS